MKVRQLRRKQSRRWDSIHSSWSAVLDHNYMWPIRKERGCTTYSAWCAQCNAALFPEIVGRFPRNVQEFNDFEDTQQKENV
jgi:hypothetical protein